MLACSCCNRPFVMNETYQYCDRGLFWSGEAPYRLVPKEMLEEFSKAQKAYTDIIHKMGQEMIKKRNDALAELEKDKSKPRVLPSEHQVLTATLPKGTPAEEYSDAAKDEAKEMRNEKDVPEGMYT